MANTDPNDPFNPVNAGSAGANTDPNDPFNPANSGGAAGPTPLREGAGLGEALETGAGNLGTSFGKQLSNAGYMIAHPIETAEDIGRAGIGEYDLATGQTGQNADIASAVNQHYKDNYGSWQGFKNAVATDPFGVIMDLGAVVDPAVGLAKAGTTAAKVGELARIATNPVYATTRAAGKISDLVAPRAGNLLADTAGVLSGTGGESLKIATKTGRESGLSQAGANNQALFKSAINDQDTASDTISSARDAVTQIRNNSSNQFATEKANIPDTPLSSGFLGTLNNAFNKLYGEVGPSPKSGLVTNPTAFQALKDVNDKVSEWYRGIQSRGNVESVHSADELKRSLDDIVDKYADNPGANRVVKVLRKTIADAISNQSREYANLMKSWGGTQDLLDELNRTLSLNSNATTDTAIRKLQSSLRDQVNTGFDVRKRLVDILEQYSPGLKARLAGQTLKSVMPRGVARLGPIGTIFGGLSGGLHGAGLGAAFDLLMSSPKAQGTIANTVGRMTPGVNRFKSIVGSPYATRAASIIGRGVKDVDTSGAANNPSPFETP